MLKNITEYLVEQKLALLWRNQNYCKCDTCREDILAFALNRLPAHYISTPAGELFARAKMLSASYDFEIMRELVIAIKTVGENPHHP